MTAKEMALTLPAPALVLAITPPSQVGGDLWLAPQPAPGAAGPPQIPLSKGEVRLASEDGRRVLLAGLGAQEELDAEALRQAGGRLATWLVEHEIHSAAVEVEQITSLPPDGALQAFCEGLLLGAFRFERHRSGPPERPAITVHLVARSHDGLERLVRIVTETAAGVNLARAWAHEPPNILNPVTLAAGAEVLASRFGLQCTVLGKTSLEEMEAWGVLSVGFGSKTPSQLIILEHAGASDTAAADPTIVVGKAITFDTGGYTLKTRDGLVGMKYDKCGGMAVIGLMRAVAGLQLRSRVVGIIAAAENMISEHAYRPNDIITTLSGKTVEIISTDAEGRMVLSDALTYAQQAFQPKALIDLATLTGGVVTALGSVRAGLMANDEELASALISHGERTHERLWRLPLDKEYVQQIRGDDSDLKNSGGRKAQPVIGGVFLNQFVEDQTPWAHVDIAGVAAVEEHQPYCPKGATGFGVRLLVDYLVAQEGAAVGQ